MTTDNRTNEPTPEQEEAAAKELADYEWVSWEVVPDHIKVIYRAQARAVLEAAERAAQGAAPQAPIVNANCMTDSDGCEAGTAPQAAVLKTEDMSIMNGYLVLSVNEHTCGTGPDGHYGAHEPGCGYEPLVNLAEVPGYPADAAAAMDRVNRLHQTVVRGNSMLGEELEAWCVHCNIPYPCHTMQALAPSLPSSGVDEDKLAEVIARVSHRAIDQGTNPRVECIDSAEVARAVIASRAEWLATRATEIREGK